MEDEAWLADYFSVVGARNDGDLELLDPELHSPEMLKCVWEDAITDIAVVRTGKGEICPEGYELIDRTPTDNDADLNHGSFTSWGLRRAVHLAVRRQHISKREDYVAEIRVVFTGDSDDKLPEGQGWELVEKSASGKSANLNKGGDEALLAVRRAVRDLVDCPAAVCSVCVLLQSKGEHPPPGYRVIQKNLNKGKSGGVVQLGYQVGGALSTVRLPFRSRILDRYPEQDSALFPFPGDQLPMFVYPKGMLLEQRSGRDTPKSSFFSFVFTNVHGCRTFTACLTFYEPILHSAARRLTKMLFTCQPPPDSPGPDDVGPEQATQGRMRMGLHGSTASFGGAGGLSGVSQPGQVRQRSSTGSWSGKDYGSIGASAGWPRDYVRGAGAGVGVCAAGGRCTPPSATSTSWTKLSTGTLAAHRFNSAANNNNQQSSPGQPSAAEVFAGGLGGSAGAGAGAGAGGATSVGVEKEPALSSPMVLNAAYSADPGGGGGGGGSRGVGCDAGARSNPFGGRRWEGGDVPFREKKLGEEEREEAGGVSSVAAAERETEAASAGIHGAEAAEITAATGVARGATATEGSTIATATAITTLSPTHDAKTVRAASAASAPGRTGGAPEVRGDTNTVGSSSDAQVGSDDLSDEEYDLMCRREDRPCIFAPKTICVISRFPIYGVLRRFLRHLYAISLSRSGVPLERYISMFVSCIPMPPPGGCPFHVYLEHLENQDPRRSRLKPLSLQMPPAAWLPLMDIDFAAPFRCLSVQSVVTVFALMLQEAKILFLSSRAELLTQVMEALRSLLFPMEWQSVYVPQLPYALAGYLECPGGFMIGMRLTKSELERGTGGTATAVRDLGLEGMANAVNLDAGEVLLHSGHLVDSAEAPAGGKDQASGEINASTRGGSQPHSPRSSTNRQNSSIGSDRNRRSWPKQQQQQLHRSQNRRGKRSASSVLRQALSGFCCRGGDNHSTGPGGSSISSSGSSSNSSSRRSGGGGGGGQTVGGIHTSFIAKDEETATPWLPELLHDGLTARLDRELFGKAAGVRVGVEDELDQYESAFEFAPAPDSTDTFVPHFSSERIQMVDARGDRLGTAGKPAPERHHGGFGTPPLSPDNVDTTLVVRDCFLCTMAHLLGGICGSLRQSERKRSRHSLRTKPLDELFNMKRFLDGLDQGRGSRPFLQRLTSTQMFWVTVQQWLGRSSADSCRLLFFEECVTAIQNRRAGAVVPWRDNGGGTVTPRGDSGDERGGWSDDGFIPLVDEVRLKRPDLYGLSSYNLYGSARLEGSRSTPLATPLAGRRRQRTPRQRAGDGHDDDDCGGGGENGDGRQRKKVAPTAAAAACADADDNDEADDFCQICTGPPIIIPGPTAQGISGEGKQPSFRYDDGWPTPLDRNLLRTPPEALPPVVLELQLHANSHSSQQQQKQAAAAAAAAVAASENESKSAGTPASASVSSPGQDRSGSGHVGYSARTEDSGSLRPGYEGDSRFRRPHGKGRLVYVDSTVYEGEFRQGRRHGQGSMFTAGTQYTGQWKLGRKDGQGEMRYPDGARYEGNWSNDQREGFGSYFYASGAVYEGLWKEGRMHGKGSYTSASGSCYEGMYRCGVRCGHAKMEYSGGQTYVGEWADGVRSGFGKYTLADGTVFEGQFMKDKKHGAGTLCRPDGRVTGQLWENGKLVGEPPPPPLLPAVVPAAAKHKPASSSEGLKHESLLA